MGNPLKRKQFRKIYGNIKEEVETIPPKKEEVKEEIVKVIEQVEPELQVDNSENIKLEEQKLLKKEVKKK